MFERDDKTERFYAPASDPGAVRDGFAWLQSYAEAHLSPDAMVWLPTLAELTSVPAAIGERRTAELRRSRNTRLGMVKISLVTDRNAPGRYTNGPVLGLWPGGAQLDSLDELDAPGLCVVGGGPEIDGWRLAWNPSDARTGMAVEPSEVVSNQVVVAALKDLTDSVNLTTGITHPSDKKAAVEALKILRKAGESFEPIGIKAWAIRNGWPPRHARSLAKLAGKIAEGRTVQDSRGGAHWKKDILERWRAEARKPGQQHGSDHRSRR